MSLFHINRYVGDDDVVVDDKSRCSSAKKLLEKLKREAESRKKQRLKLTETPDPKHTNDEQNSDENVSHHQQCKTPNKFSKNKDRKRKQSEKDRLEERTVENEEPDCLQKRLLADSESSEEPASKVKRRKIRNKEHDKVDHTDNKILKENDLHTKKLKTNKILNSTHTPHHDLKQDSSENKSDDSSSSSVEDDDDGDEDSSPLLNEAKDDVPFDDEMDQEDLTSSNNVEKVDNPNEIGGFTVLGEVKGKAHKQIKRVLPDWLADPSVISSDLRSMTVPVSQISDLDQGLMKALQKNGITQFFPVQIQVIPMMLESLKMSFLMGKAGFRPSDICVSAPTGSGKTLAFVLPIVQALKSRVTCQVRALTVLPVRDLAIQVFKVFKTYCENTQLKVALLVGQKQFHQEQQSLVKKRCWGYESLADIVVATPGRLVDHINTTTGFNLNQLRFMVIDEADKMMDHIKQDWLAQVEGAVYCNGRPTPGALTVANTRQFQIPLQKLLFSATLSQNPDKLQQLNLFQPKLFTSVAKGSNILKPVDLVMSPGKLADEATNDDSKLEEKKGEFVGKYTTPDGLTEFFVECTAAQKPLIILHFLHNVNFRNILCFTNSLEATHRLYHLIKLVGGVEVREFSSGLHTAKRNRILQQLSKGKIDIVICSDAMARGMDIENVKYVISYDPPPFIKTYIHRVGRTARAGKVGTAITMLQKKEFFHFKKMTREAGKTSVKELKVTNGDIEPMVPAFQTALEELQQVLQVEKMKRKSKG